MMAFVDLNAQFQKLEAEIRRRIDAVLQHGQYILGPEVAELESRLASFCGVKHCVSCASGTDALLLILLALGVGPGDAVFTSPFTFVATGEAVARLGAVPVFVDIEAHSLNMDPAQLELAIRAVQAGDASIYPLPRVDRGVALRPKVVIPVDLFGLPAAYGRIKAQAHACGLAVLADAAQSLGAVLRGRMAVGAAQAAATSFFPSKPLGCYGDGGAVLTDDSALAMDCLSLRAHGRGKEKYEHVRVGLNSRLDTLQAAVLLAKLSVFPDELERRRQIAAIYTRSLTGVQGLKVPRKEVHTRSAWAQYTLRHPHREAIRHGLKSRGVPSVVYYPQPLHLQQAFMSLGYTFGDFPVAEKVSQEVFSLPMHAYLDEATVEAVCLHVKEIVSELEVRKF